MKKQNPYEFTDDEKAFIRSSSSMPAEARKLLGRNLDNNGVATSALMKAAARLRAESDLIQAGIMLGKDRDKFLDIVVANTNAIEADSAVKEIRGELEMAKEEIMRLKARDSMAVFSED